MVESPSPNGFQRVAVLDLELGPEVTLLNMRLVRTPTGTMQVYPAEAPGMKSAAIAPAFRAQIADLAVSALETSLGATSQTPAA